MLHKKAQIFFLKHKPDFSTLLFKIFLQFLSGLESKLKFPWWLESPLQGLLSPQPSLPLLPSHSSSGSTTLAPFPAISGTNQGYPHLRTVLTAVLLSVCFLDHLLAHSYLIKVSARMSPPRNFSYYSFNIVSLPSLCPGCLYSFL